MIDLLIQVFFVFAALTVFSLFFCTLPAWLIVVVVVLLLRRFSLLTRKIERAKETHRNKPPMNTTFTIADDYDPDGENVA